MPIYPFHIAVQVRDIPEAKDFYHSKMGLSMGRHCRQWIDFNMFGHQYVTHLNTALGSKGKIASISNSVDKHDVPVPHFGVVLPMEKWKAFADKISLFIDSFIIEPYIRFEGQTGEQGTLFFSDPSGNALEFKGFKNIERELFANN
ncbi:VOC family protein [Aliikangiella sp. G2MR2-5]|uniref:VOC family protein n=1 Tax=Aliikangiella sp. G2MR2-5 TaxID=2788943 RepID=UPI0018A96EB2|nr:VOC family protein [Aliikangiella sp. G2MR2-5]